LNLAANFARIKFRHNISIVEACYQLSSRRVNDQSVINWTVVGQLSRQCLRAPTLDHCSLSHRSSSSVYSTILSRGSISNRPRCGAASVMSVSVFVCRSVYEHISETTLRSLPTFSCLLPMAVILWRLSDRLYTSGFMDDVIFALILEWTIHMEVCRCRCSEWRHCVVVRRLTSLLRRIGCVVS